MLEDIILYTEKTDTIFILLFSIVGWFLFLMTLIFRRKKMQEVVNRLEKQLSRSEETIIAMERELSDERLTNSNLRRDINTIRENHSNLSSAVVYSKNSEKQQEKNKIKSFEKVILFNEYEEQGYFLNQNKIAEANGTKETVYRIDLNTEKEGKLTLVNFDNPDYISNKDVYLGLCDVKFSPDTTRSKIEVVGMGKAHLEGDKWIVDEKVKIEIV